MIRDLAKRHPLAGFVILACIFSWWLVPIVGYPLGSGPFFAALVVVFLTEGRAGLVGLIRQMTRWRVGWGWYAVALLLPALAALIAAFVTVRLGAPSPSSGELAMWTEIPFTFALVLLIPVFGPWEEPGFRGLGLTQLMRRQSVLVAGLVVGVIHVFWHLPLFFTGDIPTADVVYILSAGVVFAWIVTGSGGSVLLAMLMHASSNAVSGEYISPMFTGSHADTLGWVRASIWVLAAVTVFLVAGRSFRRSPAAPEPKATRAPVTPSVRSSSEWRRDDIDDPKP